MSNDNKDGISNDDLEKVSTLDLISELKRRYQVLSRPEQSCVLLGPPCTGIETQSAILKKEWGICSISRNDILKADATENSPISLKSGVSHLSDELGSFRCRRGFVLQNFPESSLEAKEFDSMIASNHPTKSNYKVLLMDVPAWRKEEHPVSSDIWLKRAESMCIDSKFEDANTETIPKLADSSSNHTKTSESLICPNRDVEGLGSRLANWWTNTQTDIANYYGERITKINATESRDKIAVEISKVMLS